MSKLPIPEVPIFLYKPCTDKQPRPADGILTSIEVSDIVLIPTILTDLEFKIPVKNKKIFILGTGGTAKTAYKVLKDLGALEIRFVSRNKKDNAITYEELISNYANDVEVILSITRCIKDSELQNSDLSMYDKIVLPFRYCRAI